MSTGKADDDGSTRAKRFHRTCRGIGDGMRAREIRRNTGHNLDTNWTQPWYASFGHSFRGQH